MRAQVFLFWLFFYSLLLFRLEFYVRREASFPRYRNSEIFFSAYQKRTDKKSFSSPLFLRDYPNLEGLYLAVWHGDLGQLPLPVVQFYGATGTLAVLALSGQHVWGFLFVATCFLHALIRCFYFLFPRLCLNSLQSWPKFLKGLALPFSALVLLITSRAAGSALRTFVLVCVLFVVKKGCKISTQIQCLCSGAALVVLWDPSLLFQPSFVLSFLGVVLLFCLEDKPFLQFFFYPVLLYPLLAFYFGKISLWAPLFSGPIDCLWMTVWIPLGFMIPFFSMGWAVPLLGYLEKILACFWALHAFFAQLSWLVPQRVMVPNLYEVILLEIWAVGGALFFLQRNAGSGIVRLILWPMREKIIRLTHRRD